MALKAVRKIAKAASKATKKAKKKVYDPDKKATPSSVERAVKSERSKARAEKSKETSKKGTQGTGFRFASKKTTSEPAAGRVNARTGGDDKAAYEQEYGRGGKENITSGKKSYTRMDEAASKGSRKRADTVAKLETKEEKGTITKKESAQLKRLNKLSKDADVKRTRTAGATLRAKAQKDKGITLAGGASNYENRMDPLAFPEKHRITVGKKDKVKEKDVHIGNTTNGIKRDGEIIGSPTANQIKTAMRDFDARNAIAAKAKVIKEAKAFIKRARGPEGTPAMRRDANTIEKLMDQMKGRKSMASENARRDQARRRAQDTPEKKAARREEARKSYARSQKGLREKARKAVPATPMAHGGSVTGKARTGHTDMRKGGLFR